MHHHKVVGQVNLFDLSVGLLFRLFDFREGRAGHHHQQLVEKEKAAVFGEVEEGGRQLQQLPNQQPFPLGLQSEISS